MPLSGRLERFSQPELDLWPRHCTCNNGRAQSVSCRSYPFAFVSQKCASSFKRSDIRARRTPPPLASEQGRSEFRGLSVSGARTYSAASGLIRTLTVLATPSVSVPLNLQPRRVRSHCRVSPAGRFELYFCGQFSVCLFRIRGREPWSIFPPAKVGLTAHRKIYLSDFRINFYQSPPYR